MPFISRTELPEEVRLPHLKAYREDVRRRLQFAATEAERQHLLGLLDKADDSKPYYGGPTPLGAIDPTKVPQTFL